MKMPVFYHIRAITRRTAIQRDLPRKAGLHKRIEAVIDGRVGNLRHRFLGADENFLGGRMIAFVQQHVINLLTLGREAQTGGTQLFRQVLLILLVAAGFHLRQTIYTPRATGQDLE